MTHQYFFFTLVKGATVRAFAMTGSVMKVKSRKHLVIVARIVALNEGAANLIRP